MILIHVANNYLTLILLLEFFKITTAKFQHQQNFNFAVSAGSMQFSTNIQVLHEFTLKSVCKLMG